MTTNPTTSETPKPGLPSPTSTNPKTRYVLYYMGGGNPHTQWTEFESEQTEFRKVVDRAKDFCQKTNRRFVRVVPAITDLNAEEKRHEES